MRSFFILLLFPLYATAQQSIPPVGMWRDHLPYTSAIDIAPAGEKVYCATPYSLFSVAMSDKSIERMSRVTGLNETGISAIHFEQQSEKLLVAYTNSNIDIIYRNDIFNIPDIERDNIVGDKTIHDIFSRGGNFYLSTGLGVIVIDGERYEVKETWFIGEGGTQTGVNDITSDNTYFYAATQQGLKRALLNSPGLADYNNWQLLSGNTGLANDEYEDVLVVQDRVITHKDDSLFVFDGTQWSLFYTDGWQVSDASASENRIILCQHNDAGAGKLTVLDTNGTVIYSFQQPAAIALPRKAISMGDMFWVADELKGLAQINTQGGFERILPNSPPGLASGDLLSKNNILYVAAGGVNDNWVAENNSNGVYVLNDGSWDGIDSNLYPQLDSAKDILTLAVDPVDESLWLGSFGGGLLHVTGLAHPEVYKQNVLGNDVSDPAGFKVAGLAFDQEKTLWIANYGAAQPLVAKTRDGNFTRFSIPFSLPGNALAQLIIDDNNYKWMLAPKAGGLLAFDHGTSVENIGDDHWKQFTPGSGNGNLPGNEVLSVAKDKNGFIWVGTNNGIGVIQCAQEAFTSSCDAVWPVVQEGNFAGYLFKGERVRSIAVDGGDRKWIATDKGAWLISETGEHVIYHFTEENSPLLSSQVSQIAIDGITGEVFFSTARGICSFRSTATESSGRNEQVLVFPNPVPPGYTGSIGIRGLATNAIVKITEMNGRLVYQARATGGQAVWDGRDYKGRKISTGVYLVLVSNDERTEKTAAKIVFINR